MRRWLDGVADVVVRQGDEELVSTEVRFGTSTERVALVDGDGVPVMIDKWGLVQRPFSGRGEGVVDQLVDVTEQTLDVLEQECGVHAWLAFGSLLGAVRDGRVIAHDSDVDVAFLSSSETPAGVNREIYGITRALRRAGLRVVNKSGGFVTVMFKAPDGAPGSLDIYSCFYVDDLLHETATVRTAVPRSAIEPLGPARGSRVGTCPSPPTPTTMLAVSYGEGWRVPDPSFQHRPGRAVNERFEDWQGSLMTGRRAWEQVHRQETDALAGPTHGLRRLGRGAPAAQVEVVDLGCGTGRDVLHHARQGHRATGVDFGRNAFAVARRASPARTSSRRPSCRSTSRTCRDVLSVGALLSRTLGRPRVLTAGGLLESLKPADRENVWPLVRMLMRGGGDLLVELTPLTPATRGRRPGSTAAPGGPRHPLSAEQVTESVEAAGGRVVETVHHRSPDGSVRSRLAATW